MPTQETLEGTDTPGVIALLRLIFYSAFCVARKIPQRDATNVGAREFCEWLDRNLTDVDPVACCRETRASKAAWDLVVRMVGDPVGVVAVERAWYEILLGYRPPPTTPVASVNVVANVTFADGQIATAQCYCDAATADGPLTDAVVATVINLNAFELIRDTVQTGLNAVHAAMLPCEYRSAAGDDPYDALMAGVVRLVVPTLPVDQQAAALNYVRLIRRCVRLPVSHSPPAASRPESPTEAHPPPLSPTRPRGGWDD